MKSKVSRAIEILEERHGGEEETGVVVDREVRVSDAVER